MPRVAHSGPRSPKTRKQQAVRDHIWAAAIDLFYRAGFESVNIDQIAAAAGVSRRTFFRYFASKEDVLASTIRNFGDALSSAISSQPSSPDLLHVAKTAIAEVLAPQFPGDAAKRMIYILRRSGAARNAQHLWADGVEEKLASVFSAKARRRKITFKDRILASITMSATRICTEAWMDHPRKPITKIVEEVFESLAELGQAQSTPRPLTRKTPRR